MRFLFIILFPFFSFAQKRITVNPGGSGGSGGITQSQLDDSTAAIRAAFPTTSTTINRSIQRLNMDAFNSAYGKYNGWFGTYDYGSTHAVIVREGTEHLYNGSDAVYMVRYSTTDGGHTWVKDTLHSEATYDVRAYACGVTPAGTILIFYTRYKGPSGTPPFVSNRVMRSTDGGETWTHSSDLAMNGVTHEFSAHGAMEICDNGDLLQTFYGDVGDANTTPATVVPKVYTLRSTDDGVTWGSAVNIKVGNAGESLLWNEASAVHLGSGRWICAIRKEEGLNKLCYIFNSSDDALTWTQVGKAVWGSSEIPGVSPLLIKKNDSTAYLVSTWRGSINAFGENEIYFGDSTAATPHRIFYEANNELGFGINFGYPVPVKYSTVANDIFLAFYDTSTRLDGVTEGTDVVVIPLFLKRYSEVDWMANYAMNPSTAYYLTAQGITLDELAINNLDGDRSFYFIREDGTYNFQFTHNLTTTNATGTYRRVVFEKWNKVDNVLIEQMWEEKHYVANTGYAEFRFNFNYTIKAGETVRCYIEHDATGMVSTGATAPLIKITKL